MGPSRCGKTSNVISGILDWTGPAILSSVKTDLLHGTMDHRSRQGEVRIFDPTGSTDRPGNRWSPLRAAHTASGAQQAARALIDAGPSTASAENLDYFLRKSNQLLWPVLFAAAHDHRPMGDVVTWIGDPSAYTQEEIVAALDRVIVTAEHCVKRDAVAALRTITGVFGYEDRTRSSIFATTSSLLIPWEDPLIADSATGCDIDLDWLLAGNNTLYICAPLHEHERLTTLFGGLLNDLISQAYTATTRTGRTLPKPLLLVMDEAGNTPLQSLPQIASTCAGIGLLLVTIWQSKAQLDHTYGRRADTVLANHGTKIIYSGVSDRSTLDFASALVGDEEITQRSTSWHGAGRGLRQTNESATTARLIPADLIRQVAPHQALLVHGTLRPAHLIGRDSAAPTSGFKAMAEAQRYESIAQSAEMSEATDE